MLEIDRDEYAGKYRRGPGFVFWLLWVVATLSAQLASSWLFSFEWLGRSRFELPVRLSVSFLGGAVLGLAQALVLYPYFKRRGSIEWLIATALGAVLGLVAVISSTAFFLALPAIFCLPIPVLSVVAIIANLVLALPQWLVLRQYVRRPELWLLASLVTAMLIFAPLIFALHIFESTRWFFQLLDALIAGYVMHVMLKHPGPRATWNLGWKPEKPSPSKHKGVRLPTPSKYKEEPQPSPEELLERSRREAGANTP